MLRIALLLVLCAGAPLQVQAQPNRTENVILVTLDGLRWQELFSGADSALLRNQRYTRDSVRVRNRFWRATAAERRSALMPFMWSTIAQTGRLYGNRALGSMVDVTNPHRFSYPGYNEILTGWADPRIDSNDRRLNPNRTILEWLNGQPAFRGRVAAFGSWDRFAYIINEERSGVPVNDGFEQAGPNPTERERFLNRLQQQTPSPWAEVRLDVFTHNFALEHLRQRRPRLLYIAYGETDDFAHDGRYDFYLDAAHRTDAMLRELWEWVQADAQYRNRTTLIITVDHGRGLGEEWRSHGADVRGANEMWIAVIGPGITAQGENMPGQFYQNQVAATIAALLRAEYKPEHQIGAALWR